MKIVIASPRGLNGGIIVLHLLCKLLSDKGHDAKIFYFKAVDANTYKHKARFWYQQCKWLLRDTYELLVARITVNKDKLDSKYEKYWYTPVKGCKRKLLPWFDKKTTIVVYPEIVYGNFLNATNVCRWLLYYNRYPGDENAFGKDDLFVCYREIFNDQKLNPENNILHINHFDLDLYKQTNFGRRTGNCYVLRKGKARSDLPSDFDGIIIDDLTEKQKVETFNRCEYCYSYDMQTAYSSIAALCGCISIKVPEPGCSVGDYVKSGDTRFGVAYGDSEEELKYAADTRNLLVERFHDTSKDTNNRKQVDAFIELLKVKFSKFTDRQVCQGGDIDTV